MDAVQWSAIATADVQHLCAPFRSDTAIDNYQLEPVVGALSMPCVSLLIADAVGLGKTIEASFVVQELILRNRGAHELVVANIGGSSPSGSQRSCVASARLPPPVHDRPKWT